MRRNIRSGLAAAVVLAAVAILPVVAGDAQSEQVVVTKPGVVFHKAGSADIRGKAVERTIDSALEGGYAPCPVCFAKEISLARAGGPAIPGAAPTATFGESIPAPPVTTVTQPFGIRYASAVLSRERNAVRNPYEEIYTVVPGRSEQGAFER